MDIPNVAIISAVTALIAVLISPIVSLYIASKEFGANVLSTHRQAWISELRSEVAEVTSIAAYISLLYDKGVWKESEHFILHLQAYSHWMRVRTLINASETEHIQLELKIKSLLQVISSIKDDLKSDIVQKHIDEVVMLSQHVFKKEWQRVKKGK